MNQKNILALLVVVIAIVALASSYAYTTDARSRCAYVLSNPAMGDENITIALYTACLKEGN